MKEIDLAVITEKLKDQVLFPEKLASAKEYLSDATFFDENPFPSGDAGHCSPLLDDPRRVARKWLSKKDWLDYKQYWAESDKKYYWKKLLKSKK